MFTSQHYKAIAEILKASRPKVIAGANDPKASGRLQQFWCIVLQCAKLFEQDDPQFNPNQFVKACGA